MQAKTLIGISTYGNLPFTQLTINSIRATTKSPVDFFVVVGKPGDDLTLAWLRSEGIPYVADFQRRGFPCALNDMMDHAWSVEQAHERHVIEPCRRLRGWGLHPTDYLNPAAFKQEANGSWRHYSFDEFIDTPGVRELWSYENLIVAGNDIVPYAGAVDALIAEAERGEYEWVCSSQFDAKSLVARYPEAAQYFTGPNLNFEAWTSSRKSEGIGEVEVCEYTPLSRPWELHQDIHPPSVQPDCIKDVRNLCLFKRSVFEKIGYADVNFWPGGYFEDNDYCYRARLAGVKACGLAHSAYFHFWSRTIHQVLPGVDGGVSAHDRQFQRNAQFYVTKWGGAFDQEQWKLPFQGTHYGHANPQNPNQCFSFGDGRVKIDSRKDEAGIVDYWSRQ